MTPVHSRSMPVALVVIGAVAAALLVASAAGAADVTIGSNLAGDATSNICVASCTFIQTSGGTPVAVSPVDGIVVRWRLKAGSFGGTVTLRVLRPSGTNFTAVASSVEQTVTADLNTFVTNLPIKAGDVVALDNASSGVYFTNAPSVSLPLVKYFQPALGVSATGAPNGQMTDRELLMNADVTPKPAGGGGGGGTTPTAPVGPVPAVSNLELKPSKFRAASSGGTVARKRPPVGTTVSYTLSTAATVKLDVERKKTGHRRGGKCRTGGRAKGKRCTVYKKVSGSFNVGGVRGTNSFKFTGRLAGRKLGRGSYNLIATPSNGTRSGTAVRAKFKVR
jgi:hypothetical protein